MNYQKPEVVAFGSAVDAIQSSQNKPEPHVQDQSDGYATSAAYEADE